MTATAAKRWTLNSQLLLAIQNNDVTGASKLFNEGLDADTRFCINSEKLPAICLSVRNNDLNMVKLLIGLGASVNQRDSNGESPLHITCEHGYFTIAKLLLDNRADVQCKNKNGQTPIHLAAKMGRTDMVNVLISYGASLNKTDNLGRTPLHYAAAINYSAVVRVLLEAGADAKVIDKHGNTALHFAADSVGMNSEGIVYLCTTYPLAALRANQQSKTPLHIVVGANRRGQEEALRVMLNAITVKGSLALPVLLSPRSQRGHTPLHLAVLERKVSLVRLLIASGAEVDTRDQLGRTPLDCAVRDSDWNIVALLLAAGASVRRLINDGRMIQHVEDDLICDMLLNSAFVPMKLTALCRRTISRTWGPTFQRNLSSIPRRWRDFLSYKEL
ncbi:UNVERIFIED_CONTAM: hypothetical protein RMT77_013367 [Armadillidium vulgare]